MNRIEFDPQIITKHIGEMAERIVAEVLSKKGFDVRKGVAVFGIIDSIEYRKSRKWSAESYPSMKESIDRDLANVEAFVGRDKILTLLEFMRDLDPGRVKEYLHRTRDEAYQRSPPYVPDLIARKDDKVCIVEIKANTGTFQLRRWEEASASAKKYGFVPMLVTLNLKVEASHLTITET